MSMTEEYKIYNKDEHEFILNQPFLHIKKVNDRDS